MGTPRALRYQFVVLSSIAFLATLLSALVCADEVLFPIPDAANISMLESRHVTLSATDWDGHPAIRMDAQPNQDWPGVTLRPQAQFWDLSALKEVCIDIRNISAEPVVVAVRVDSVSKLDERQSVTEQVTLAPDELQTLRVTLPRRAPERLRDRLLGMRGNPAQLSTDEGLDAARVDQVILFVFKEPHSQSIEFSELSAVGSYKGGIWFDPNADPFPMIDRFGQYMHADWPGKTHDESDLVRRREQEQRDLEAVDGRQDLDQYGGWEAGPKLRATGHFRVQRHRGRWWLVDPDGHLFWSHGIDCVDTFSATTPITDREFYFAALPEKDSPLGFYGTGNWAPHGYYHDRGQYTTFNFTAANLYRKYGSQWSPISRDLAHQRLRSWGLNTIGNWSDRETYRMHRTAFVVTSGTGGKTIQGSEGYWGKFPDPFDPEFAEATRRNMARYRADANSPWCIGVFIDNELAWGDELSLAQATLRSPATQAAKCVMIDDLKSKYGEIGELNEQWGTDYLSWDALSQGTEVPDAGKAGDDLRAFYSRIAEQYFRICRDAVKQVAPKSLYLGCRFSSVNDRALRAAGMYCDVIGLNRYDYSVADFQLPAGVDRPAIIGEFHFGALDRGMFHPGLKPTSNQDARAAAYRNYVTGALKNPIWVGTHWFEYRDQATTGRGDGENYQIGFVDVCDTPYPEMIKVAREIGTKMYSLRMNVESDRE